MRISILAPALKEIVTTAAKAVNKRAALPVLRHILLRRTSGAALEAVATDLEVTLLVRSDVTYWEDWLSRDAVSASAEDLLQVCKTLEGEVVITVEGGVLTLQTATDRHVLPSLPQEEFPAITCASNTPMPLPGGILQDIKRLLPLVDDPRTSTRHALTGIRFADGRITGTNGRIGGTILIPYTVGTPFTLPHRALSLLAAVSHRTEPLAVGTSTLETTGTVSLHTGNRTLITRVIEERYSDIDAVTPRHFSHEIPIIDTERLMQWLAALPTRPKGANGCRPPTVVALSRKTGMARYTGPNGNVSGVVVVPFGDYDPIQFDGVLLLTLLRARPAPKTPCVLLCNDPLSMVCCREGDTTLLLMPIRVKAPVQTAEEVHA